MKKKLSKILGVGLTLALAASLLLSAVPVMANVSSPSVDIDDEDISAAAVYTLIFSVKEDTAAGETITIKFPDDTDVAGVDTAAEIELSATSGIGSDAFSAVNPAADADVVADEDDLTVEITLPGAAAMNAQNQIGAMASVQVKVTGLVNPTEPGDYTLEVQTSEEDTYVESAAYEIETPTVGGFVYVYNPSDILLATYGGSAALMDADGDGQFDEDDYTITVGAGTYNLTAAIGITGEDVVIESAEGAADTKIDAGAGANNAFDVTGEGVTIDGFTIDDALVAVYINAEDVTVTNCELTDAATAGVEIDAGGINATVSDNVIEDCDTGILFTDMAVTDLDDVDITGNTITEANTDGAIVIGGGAGDIDITGNTITDNEVAGIVFNGTLANDNIAISGNTISLNEGDGFTYDGTAAATDVSIVENTIIDNEDDGINLTTAWTYASCYVAFNTIMDNGDNAANDDGTDDLNARFNWWGTDDDDDFDVSDDIETEPWLMSEDAATGFKVATDDASLDGKSTAGVSVSGMDDDAANAADIMIAFGYDANPEDELDGAIAFYDLFVLADAIVSPDEVNAKVKLYNSAITEDSVAYFWTGDFWAECSDQIARSGLVWVDVTEDTIPAIEDLEGTPFAVVSGEASTDLDAPVILTPAVGDDEVSLTPTFAWGAVEDADTYYFEFADNAQFVVPLVKMSDELSALMVTNYAYTAELPYSTPYYWRVKAIGDDGVGSWATGVFVTMAEPEEEQPPVVVEEQAPVIIEPIVEVITPAATPVTPGWIYAIIAVGAVLVIALLVLIVRTRRVA